MLVCLLYALILGAIQAAVAIASFRFAAKELERPPWVRVVAAAFGALGGALLARPIVEMAVAAMGHVQEAAGLMALFTFPFFLPISVAVSGWLVSEVVGGRSRAPWHTLALAFGGALAGAAVVLIPLYFSRNDPAIALAAPAITAIPSGACVLGIWLASTRARPARQL
jgi:hypothetical protein